MKPDSEIIDKWSGSAPYCEKHCEVVRAMFAPVARALVEDGLIGAGQAVLDVGTGPGDPALSVAPLVGPSGSVVGIDPVAGMVEAARRVAARLGFQNARFEVASADRLPFAADTFDAVISRFGVMFFPSPADGIREMLRVLKPGRKMALAVWGAAERNPFFYVLQRVIERYVESPPVEPDAPDAFRFASPGKLRDVLVEAGLDGVAERVLQCTIEAPMQAEEFFAMRCEISEKTREKLASLSAEQMADVRRLSIEALREYSTELGIRFPAEVVIVSGRKR